MARQPSQTGIDFVEKEWDEFATSIYPGTGQLVVDAMRITFYAGFMSMHAAIVHMLDKHSGEDTADFLERTISTETEKGKDNEEEGRFQGAGVAHQKRQAVERSVFRGGGRRHAEV
jgi:hypothetical protein